MKTDVQNSIRLAPVQVEPRKRQAGLADGTELYRLAFRIDPAFLDGQIELRFPEVLKSSAGFHFLDHYRTTIFPISEPEPFPKWEQAADAQTVSYQHQTDEGLAFGGRAEVGDDEVNLQFFVKNNSPETMHQVEPNMCLEFGSSEDFASNDLSLIHIVSGRCLKNLSEATPSPVRNGETWPLIRTVKGADTFQMPPESPSWTLIDDIAEENLMAIQSNDSRHLVGYAWDQMSQTQMSNCRYPCLHTGPGAVDVLEPGQTHTWHGKIYFVEGADQEMLLCRFRQDWKNWHQKAN